MPLVAVGPCFPQAQTARETTKTIAAMVKVLLWLLCLLMVMFSLSLFQYSTLQQLLPANRTTLAQKDKFHFARPPPSESPRRCSSRANLRTRARSVATCRTPSRPDRETPGPECH